MCQRSPGPRCASHARKAAQSASQELETLKTIGADEKSITKAKQKLANAIKIYDSTPTGQKKLAEKIAALKTSGESTSSFSSRLTAGKLLREKQERDLAEIIEQEKATAAQSEQKEKTQSVKSESTFVNVLYKEPELDDIRGYAMAVECVCGRVRYGIDYECRCGADSNNIKGYRVQEKDRELIESKLASKTRYWYHSTSHENWADVVRDADIPVHLGSEQASFERAIDHFSDTGNRHHFRFKVKLKPFARIANNICPDLNNAWSSSLEELKSKTRGRDFVRYVNSYEDGGSVSLFGNPQMFDVVEVTKEKGF